MHFTKLIRHVVPDAARQTAMAAVWILGVLAQVSLSGQVAVPTNAARPDSSGKDDPIQLSPFTVTDSGDTGYLATETMAGTRIKTSLRDVGSTIWVVTKQFLEDTGIKNASELLVHTAGTETGGPAGNFSAVNFSTRFGEAEPAEMMRSPQFATRVRGVSAPDLTRDYFPPGFRSTVTIRNGWKSIVEPTPSCLDWAVQPASSTMRCCDRRSGISARLAYEAALTAASAPRSMSIESWSTENSRYGPLFCMTGKSTTSGRPSRNRTATTRR